MAVLISEALSNGDYAIGVFLDFSKTFNTPEKYGIQGIALHWFTDYLSNKVQYVTYDGAKSKRETIKGSSTGIFLLCPLLFLLYINVSLSTVYVCFPVLYAEDTIRFVTGKTQEACV